MIPVERQPEPESFDSMVRKPGKKFLKTLPVDPNIKINWKNREYWQKALPDLKKSYRNVCAFTGLRLHPATGAATVEHFKHKKFHPQLAYEWENFRLACARVNSCKGQKENILDPFEIEEGWFELDFRTFLVNPNRKLQSSVRIAVATTIRELSLNTNNSFVEERQEYILNYCSGRFDFTYLKEYAPFIAYELERQGLVERIKEMWEGRIR